MNAPLERVARTARDYALMYIGLGWKVFPVWNVIEGNGERVCACGGRDGDPRSSLKIEANRMLHCD